MPGQKRLIILVSSSKWFKKMQMALNQQDRIEINSLQSIFGWSVNDISITSEVCADWKRPLLFVFLPCPEDCSQGLEASGNKTNVIFNRVANFLWSLQSTDYVGNYISHLDSKLQEHFKVVHSFLSRYQGTFWRQKVQCLMAGFDPCHLGHMCMHAHAWVYTTEFILTIRSQQINSKRSYWLTTSFCSNESLIN